MSNMVECKVYRVYLMELTTFGYYSTEDIADYVTHNPKINNHFVGSLGVILLQLLGYYVPVARGFDVDKLINW